MMSGCWPGTGAPAPLRAPMRYRTCARRALCCLVLAACGGTGEAPVVLPALQVTEPARAPAPSPVEDARADRAVRGEVVDGDGRGVRGAQVALVPIGLYDPSGASYARAETVDGGRFRLEGVPGWRYVVTATAPGHRAGKVLDVGVGDAGVRVELSGSARRLTGRVTESGVPRAGVEVRLLRGLGETGEIYVVESDVSGRWTAGVPAGDYLASALHAHAAAAARALPVGSDAADLELVPVGAAAPPAREVVDWVRAHATEVATAEPGRGTADLALLRALVGAARVVGLGEATHGTHEIFALKHRLVEWLVSDLGFTVFAIELGLAESFAIDDYVLGGPGDPERLLAEPSLAGSNIRARSRRLLRARPRWSTRTSRTPTPADHAAGGGRPSARRSADTTSHSIRCAHSRAGKAPGSRAPPAPTPQHAPRSCVRSSTPLPTEASAFACAPRYGSSAPASTCICSCAQVLAAPARWHEAPRGALTK
jgi:hypothetical protein